tara:strand:- start:365 stop:604 length:240 start_codon:yes stop_codon:yes gene_type:complete
LQNRSLQSLPAFSYQASPEKRGADYRRHLGTITAAYPHLDSIEAAAGSRKFKQKNFEQMRAPLSSKKEQAILVRKSTHL